MENLIADVRRVSEAAGLRWRSVDLANGRITVEASKTNAGRRVVSDLNPELVELLKLHRHRKGSRYTDRDEFGYATDTGREKTRSSISRQVLKPALEPARPVEPATTRL